MAEKLTPWFDGQVHKPVRPGVYERGGPYSNSWYARWDGKRWLCGFHYLDIAHRITDCDVSLNQTADWRGVLKGGGNG